ncbi:hypothetical protein HPB50_005251 [Hyalomma asiaticum]|uniref:Uncharacterized protein n=1 Tax=Hyalomma asiaticum TaxID=266040 RepID=A0ACB7SXQ6_HYAAI|nr:hypothetical protein HPB50_005251 [Hyalomma asiaticum]
MHKFATAADVVISIPSTAAVAQAGDTIDTTRRRSEPAAARRAAVVSTVLRSPLLEEALRHNSALLHRQLVTSFTLRLLGPMVCVTAAFVVVGLGLGILTPYRSLAAVFLFVGAVLETVSLAAYLCTCSERTRAFLAMLFGLKPRGHDVSANAPRRTYETRMEEPLLRPLPRNGSSAKPTLYFVQGKLKLDGNAATPLLKRRRPARLQRNVSAG